MSEYFLDHFLVDVLREEQRGAGVPEVVKPEGEPGSESVALEHEGVTNRYFEEIEELEEALI